MAASIDPFAPNDDDIVDDDFDDSPDDEISMEEVVEKLSGGDAVGFGSMADEPYRRETPKVGRNEPCPCGGGNKFKKCHGA